MTDALKDKVMKHKRILNDYLPNIHLKFSAEHAYKVALATFARYRPKYNYASQNTHTKTLLYCSDA
jgi:hypothetical protein